MPAIRIGLVGDYSSSVVAHRAIPLALDFVAKSHSWNVQAQWLPTKSLELDAKQQLSNFTAIWVVPGSPYESERGALEAIRFSRETSLPFLGTCGGCQHAILEYARNVLGLTNAAHAETDPSADLTLIAPLTCKLVEEKGTINLLKGSMLHAMYGKETIEEGYHCSYGLNPKLEHLLAKSDLQVAARDINGEVRGMELQGKRFFVLAQFQPERAALNGTIPVVVDYFVTAAAAM